MMTKENRASILDAILCAMYNDPTYNLQDAFEDYGDFETRSDIRTVYAQAVRLYNAGEDALPPPRIDNASHYP